jgi:hypothetical protein
MLLHLGKDYYWEVNNIRDTTTNKALLRSSRTCDTKRAMTIDMSDFHTWLYDNIETLETNTEAQNRIIYKMQQWGQYHYRIVREGKIIFS